jgi:hypothetical protein
VTVAPSIQSWTVTKASPALVNVTPVGFGEQNADDALLVPAVPVDPGDAVGRVEQVRGDDVAHLLPLRERVDRQTVSP